MNDDEVKKIINDTLDERKKRNIPKLFNDPHKAYGLVVGIAYVAFFVAFIPIIMLASSYDTMEKAKADLVQSNKDITTKIYPLLDCNQLRALLFENMKDDKSTLSDQFITNYITIKC